MQHLNKVSVIQARDNIADILNNVSCGGQRYVITKHGKQRAVIISVDEWKKTEKILQRLEDEQDIRDAEEALERIKTEGTISHDELFAKLGFDTCIKCATTGKSKKSSKVSPKKPKSKSKKQSKN